MLVRLLTFISVILSSAYAADSYNINPGQTLGITEHGVCSLVTNTHATKTAFIPTKTAGQWTSVRNSGAGSNLTKVACDDTFEGFNIEFTNVLADCNLETDVGITQTINVPMNIYLDVSLNTNPGGCILSYIKNGGAKVNFNHGDTVAVVNGDTIKFNIDMLFEPDQCMVIVNLIKHNSSGAFIDDISNAFQCP
jgi:hypothetical protein